MHREDNSLYLLYIEPKKEEKSLEPVEDLLTQLMTLAIDVKSKSGRTYPNALLGGSRYSDPNCNGRFLPFNGFMGFHVTDCGEMSDSCCLLLRSGYITNSLAAFYLKWYRNSIPKTEILKLKEALRSYISYENRGEFNKIIECELAKHEKSSGSIEIKGS